MRFVVAVFGRLPLVTPVFVYAAIMLAGGIMLRATRSWRPCARSRPLLRPSLMTALLLFALAGAAALAYVAPAYTPEQPLRRRFSALQPARPRHRNVEVASVEPGLDLADGAPDDGRRRREPLPNASSLEHAAVSVRVPCNRRSLARVRRRLAITAYATTSARRRDRARHSPSFPEAPGLDVTFLAAGGVQPGAIQPARSQRGAAAGPPPTSRCHPEGVAFRASFKDAPAEALRARRSS